LEKDERSNTVQRVVVREVGRDRRPFLGEEEEAEDKDWKREEHIPWRMVALAALEGTVGLESMEGTVALEGMEDRRVDDAEVVKAKESSPPSPLQSTEASSESASPDHSQWYCIVTTESERMPSITAL